MSAIIEKEPTLSFLQEHQARIAQNITLILKKDPKERIHIPNLNNPKYPEIPMPDRYLEKMRFYIWIELQEKPGLTEETARKAVGIDSSSGKT